MIKVEKKGRTYDVIDTTNGNIIEGGFFSREAADRAANEYRTGETK